MLSGAPKARSRSADVVWRRSRRCFDCARFARCAQHDTARSKRFRHAERSAASAFVTQSGAPQARRRVTRSAASAPPCYAERRKRAAVLRGAPQARRRVTRSAASAPPRYAERRKRAAALRGAPQARRRVTLSAAMSRRAKRRKTLRSAWHGARASKHCHAEQAPQARSRSATPRTEKGTPALSHAATTGRAFVIRRTTDDSGAGRVRSNYGCGS